MGVRENKIETYLKAEVEKRGGQCYKWVSPGRDGVPDRIILLYGSVYFREIKTPSGKPSTAQEREIARLTTQGQDAGFIYSNGDVDEFLHKCDEQHKANRLFNQC